MTDAARRPPRSRQVALLRAINVGGRTVTMTRLVEVFRGLGFSGVETFLASGNVIFDASGSAPAATARRVEAALADALGYEVAVFVRGLDDIARIAVHPAFPAEDIRTAGAFNVVFLAEAADEAASGRVAKLTTGLDRFVVHGSEIYWLCGVRQSKSTINNGVLERALGGRATIRGISTVRKLAAKYVVSKEARDDG